MAERGRTSATTRESARSRRRSRSGRTRSGTFASAASRSRRVGTSLARGGGAHAVGDRLARPVRFVVGRHRSRFATRGSHGGGLGARVALHRASTDPGVRHPSGGRRARRHHARCGSRRRRPRIGSSPVRVGPRVGGHRFRPGLDARRNARASASDQRRCISRFACSRRRRATFTRWRSRT